MLKIEYPLYLASTSPRRKKLLQSLGIKFQTISIPTKEEINPKESVVVNVRRLAKEKCEAALIKVKDGIVITADTVVVLRNRIIGKPNNKKDARRMLKSLSGISHLVYTGFAIGDSRKNTIITGYEKTEVTFYELSSEQIDEYIATGSPFDKAGAYGIQDDYGALFVKKIKGCYYNVVGFPIAKIFRTLEKMK